MSQRRCDRWTIGAFRISRKRHKTIVASALVPLLHDTQLGFAAILHGFQSIDLPDQVEVPFDVFVFSKVGFGSVPGLHPHLAASLRICNQLGHGSG